MQKSKTDRATAEANYERMQKKAKDAAIAVSEHEKQARAVDEKTVRLKALRLAREAAAAPPPPADKFQPAPRRQRQPVKKVVLAPDMAQKYEDLAQERELKHRTYGTHLPPDKGK